MQLQTITPSVPLSKSGILTAGQITDTAVPIQVNHTHAPMLGGRDYKLATNGYCKLLMGPNTLGGNRFGT